jgi:hypothetical protein
MYVRDGKHYTAGLLFGELEDAVRGVPAAEAAARTFQRRTRWGFLGYMGGLICTFVAIDRVDTKPEDPLDRNGKIALGTSAACLAGALVGTYYFTSGLPYQADAINLFNDSLPPDGPVALPGQQKSLFGPAGEVDAETDGEVGRRMAAPHGAAGPTQ